MKLSTRGRYAMAALCDLEIANNGALIPLGEIGRRQDTSMNYLEQLFVKLRKSNIVVPVRSPGGSYKLARPAAEIRIFDILATVRHQR